MEPSEAPVEQPNYLAETLQRGEMFEVLVHSPSWDYVRAYVENAVKVFSTRVINEDMDHETELVEKGKVKGLLGLLTEINNSIEVLNAERQKTQQPTTE
jgi:hypothetical protein